MNRSSPAPAPSLDLRLLAQVQARLRSPRTVTGARGLSHAGEHAAAWIALGAAGTLLDPRRRGAWVAATTAVVAAHGASVVLKRVTRRHRPDGPRVLVHVATPSRWSLPSSHATSTTAAAVAFAPLLPAPARLVGAALVPAMALSRVVLGVHHPSDVLAGSALGAAVAVAARPAVRRALAR